MNKDADAQPGDSLEDPLHLTRDAICTLLVAHYQVAKGIPPSAPTESWNFEWKLDGAGIVTSVKVSRVRKQEHSES